MGFAELGPVCQDCGKPLKSWGEHHTIEDCRWWRQSQVLKTALVRLNVMAADVSSGGSR